MGSWDEQYLEPGHAPEVSVRGHHGQVSLQGSGGNQRSDVANEPGAVGRAETPPDPAPFISAVGATMAAALASVAAGLLLGTLLPRVPATVLAVALGAGMLAVSVLLRPSPMTGLTGGLGLLAHLDAVARPLATALQSAGTALAAAAALLVLAGMGLERSDL